MSARVLARIRPLVPREEEEDIIVTTAVDNEDENPLPSVVRIPNPKNKAESFSFKFARVYDETTTQQQLFVEEICPKVKDLFNGLDVTIFAYGATGTGKTHTMSGGKSKENRGVVPRLFSAIFRRSKMLRDRRSTQVELSLSYYEIYNDRVYDLLEPREKRTAAGLPIRDNNGKTVVVGLSERPCSTLKDLENLYDQANVNRSTSATKVNAHSSRSHAILCVRVTQMTENYTRVSRISCIDLAGSEDNRRTDNNGARLVESSAINKSLFVLAQCVQAIHKQQPRIPYRESKMTRILSLGQNNGVTLMILNLAPVSSYHLETLSSLNFGNRTKKIEDNDIDEIENRPQLRGPPKPWSATTSHRRLPLRPLVAATNTTLTHNEPPAEKTDKPVKAFFVFSDKLPFARPKVASRPSPPKRRNTTPAVVGSRITKPARLAHSSGYGKPTALQCSLSKEAIVALIERQLDERLAERALNNSSSIQTQDIGDELKQRLGDIEHFVCEKEHARNEGLHFLPMANQSLWSPLLKAPQHAEPISAIMTVPGTGPAGNSQNDALGAEDDDDDDSAYRRRCKTMLEKPTAAVVSENNHIGALGPAPLSAPVHGTAMTPRTQRLLAIINTRQVSKIQLLKGVGAKRAEAIVNAIRDLNGHDTDDWPITDLKQLGELKGVGIKTVENMKVGLAC